jgi:hypothetical protein
MAAGGEEPTGLVQVHYQTLVDYCQVFISYLLSIGQGLPGTFREDFDQAWMPIQRCGDADLESRVSLPDSRHELGQVVLDVESEGQKVRNYNDSPNALAEEIRYGTRQVGPAEFQKRRGDLAKRTHLGQIPGYGPDAFVCRFNARAMRKQDEGT